MLFHTIWTLIARNDQDAKGSAQYYVFELEKFEDMKLEFSFYYDCMI